MFFKQIKGVHIDGRKHMSIKDAPKSFLDPKFVYLPIAFGNTKHITNVQVGDSVLKGQKILARDGRFGHPIHCPVSGVVTSIKKMWHPMGKMVEMLEIENDFEEKTVEGFGIKLEELTKEAIVDRIKEAGIVGLGGAGFPTFVKYLPAAAAEVLLINAAECEPYITADYTLILNETEKLMRGIEYMLLACGAKVCKIAIKKTKKEAIEVLNKAIKDHPSIEVFLMNDVYPAGWERYIVEHATGKTYNGLPSEVGAVVNNVQTAIAVCEAVEENKPLIEKVVTFTGEGLVSPCNIKVKIGTKVSDLVPFVDGYIDNLTDAYFIAGGPMTGKAIMFDDLVVTNSLGSIIVKPKVDGLSLPCMGCGKCAEVCPAGLTPTEIKSAHAGKDMVALNDLNTMKCVQCGLCSYICPSRVEITEAVGKAKDDLIKYNALKGTRK